MKEQQYTQTSSKNGHTIVRRATAMFTLVASLLFAQTLLALAPVVNIENSAVPAGFTATQVHKAIVAAGAKRKWHFKKIAAGHLEALHQSRGYSAIITVKFDTKTYSLAHKSSVNLQFADGKIHKTFNKWLATLDRDIQEQFVLEVFLR